MDFLLHSTVSLLDERTNVNSKSLLMKNINNKCNYRAFVMIQQTSEYFNVCIIYFWF